MTKIEQLQLQQLNHEFDCIIHFHSALKQSSREIIPVTSQFSYECGGVSCGINIRDNMKLFELGHNTVINVVHLDHHGPNIMFSSKTNPNFINQFINEHWNIDKQTTGLTDEYK